MNYKFCLFDKINIAQISPKYKTINKNTIYPLNGRDKDKLDWNINFYNSSLFSSCPLIIK